MGIRPDQTTLDDNITWHVTETDHVLSALTVNHHHGLIETDVKKRIAHYGFNELDEQPLKSPFIILWEQIVNPLVLLLILAALISALLGKMTELTAISGIIILNAILGVVQEYRAEKAMAALIKMAAPLVRVKRDGNIHTIEARLLVPGDIIMLEAGNIVPADARVIESHNLRVQESSLTGESEAVEKSSKIIKNIHVPIGDRYNMLYLGTAVTYGRGQAVIVSTGMKTELGHIAQLIQSVESEKTPLQKRMNELGHMLFKVALAIMALSIMVGLMTGAALQDVLLNSVAIAVAVVPEGLPAVITVALALGAQRMLQRNALIRKLPAVETLGSVTTICSDKTGTLTENNMKMTVIDVADNVSALEQIENLHTFNPQGTQEVNPTTKAQVFMLLGSILCTDISLSKTEDQYYADGDPTEAAIVMGGTRIGLIKPELDQAFPRIAELPFDSERKLMTTIHEVNANSDHFHNLPNMQDNELIVFSKGAVDVLLELSSHVLFNGQVLPMSTTFRDRIERSNANLAQNGLRVLGMAYRTIENNLSEIHQVESELIFVGMVGIIDPPREEVKQSVAIAKRAGIRPVMITGDHPLTAYAIAREIGIIDDGQKILTGYELSQMTQHELEQVVESISVFARVTPEHKLNIVQAIQAKGHVTAMTGDGVNDAPALKKSNIGVAMGITGSAVSKEASKMVLLDDNFQTIVSAVEEGRTIYDNVRRFIKYLLASNTGELIVLLLTQLIQGMTIPLTTLQILWMNLITDGVPALALGVEKSEKGVMLRNPYAPDESLFGRGLGRHIILIGSLLGFTGVLLGYWAWSSDLKATNGAPAWNTMVFMFLSIAQMGHALGLRSHTESLFSMDFFGNRFLLAAVVFTVFIQLAAIYLPFFNDLFGTNPLTLNQLVLCLVLSSIVFWGVELEKWAIRRNWLQ